MFKISETLALPYLFVFFLKLKLTRRPAILGYSNDVVTTFQKQQESFQKVTSKGIVIYFWKIRILYLIPELQWH